MNPGNPVIRALRHSVLHPACAAAVAAMAPAWSQSTTPTWTAATPAKPVANRTALNPQPLPPRETFDRGAAKSDPRQKTGIIVVGGAPVAVGKKPAATPVATPVAGER